MGAGWSKSARGWLKRANQVLISAYQPDHNSAHLFSTRLNSVSRLPPRVPPFRERVRLAITTTSTLQILILCRRNTSRIALLTRFRSTAPGNVFLLAIIPSLALLPPLREKYILKYSSATLSARMTWPKPSPRNNRCAVVKLAGTLDCEADALNRESGTALGTACIDDSAATARFHAHQKAMGAFSPDYGWLICTFHVFFLGKS